MNWRRPSNVEQSLIYSVFESSETCSFGEKCTYRIEDIHEDQIEKVIDILKNNFVESSLMLRSKRITDDEVSMEELIQYWRKILDQKISIVCVKEGTSSCDIIGINLLGKLTLNYQVMLK
jgi:hypothetical protein